MASDRLFGRDPREALERRIPGDHAQLVVDGEERIARGEQQLPVWIGGDEAGRRGRPRCPPEQPDPGEEAQDRGDEEADEPEGVRAAGVLDDADEDEELAFERVRIEEL